MVPFLPLFPLAQVTPSPQPPVIPPVTVPVLPPPESVPRLETLPQLEPLPPQEVIESTEVRPLPGKLDEIPVFNSNSPELVQTEGILLSTFPPDHKKVPAAHLNFPFQGRFDIFSHHIVKARTLAQTRTLFQGILIYNPSANPVKLDILQGATYLTSPDALFLDLPDLVENPVGKVYAGPGSRTVNDVLRQLRQAFLPPFLIIPPQQTVTLINLPIPLGKVVPTSNGRSTLIRLSSSGPVYVANLAMFAPLNPNGSERPPTSAEWQKLLNDGGLAGPRDQLPTPLEQSLGNIVYGRVAGVAQGSQWNGLITDNPQIDFLSIPLPGQSFSYVLDTVPEVTFGTGQIQSAPMLARYPDTAYFAHGNYGIEYNLTLPLSNLTDETQMVIVKLSTPLKADEPAEGLLFVKPRDREVFFRGTVKVSFNDEHGLTQSRYVHLVQRRGQPGEPLVRLSMAPKSRTMVQVDFLYPPDSTPPQVLMIKTLNLSN